MEPLALTPSSLYSELVHRAREVTKSVCFSPDGKLLATGASPGDIRVSSRTFVLAIVIAVAIIFEANAQHGATFGTLGLGYRHGATPRQTPASPALLLGRFLVGREIPRLWVGRWYDEDLEDDGRVVEDPCKHRQSSCCSYKRGYQL